MFGGNRVERVASVLFVALATCCNGIVHDSHARDTGDAAGIHPDDSGSSGVSSAGAGPLGSGGARKSRPPPVSNGTGGRATMRDAGARDGATRSPSDAATHTPSDAAADATSTDAAPSTGGAGNGGTTGASGGVTGSGGLNGTGGTDDNVCGAYQKFCGGLCTPPAPRVGCGLTGCDACTLTAPQNGYVTCQNGACAFDCLSGYTKQGNGCVGSDPGSGGNSGSCNASRCPVCNVVSGPACCTSDGKCGCPQVPYVPQTCAVN
jgi:hypothetical protein